MSQKNNITFNILGRTNTFWMLCFINIEYMDDNIVSTLKPCLIPGSSSDKVIAEGSSYFWSSTIIDLHIANKFSDIVIRPVN